MYKNDLSEHGNYKHQTNENSQHCNRIQHWQDLKGFGRRAQIQACMPRELECGIRTTPMISFSTTRGLFPLDDFVFVSYVDRHACACVLYIYIYCIVACMHVHALSSCLSCRLVTFRVRSSDFQGSEIYYLYIHVYILPGFTVRIES